MLRQEQEKREIIEQQNHDLERLVEERTQELKEKMALLASASEEIQCQVEIQARQSAEIQIVNTRLQEQNVRLQELNVEKNEFLSIAAHDLKNPLNNIMMLTDMLRQPNLIQEESKRAEAFELVINAARRMLTLIENLLDINMIEQGKLSLSIIELDIASKTRVLVDGYVSTATKKNIRIECHTPDRAMIKADTTALSQVMDNLLSNAVKYSPLGSTVRMHVEYSVQNSIKATHGAYTFSVQDEGPGFTDEDKTKLFGKFVRLSAQPTGGEHSTGLGLSIVKRMVEAMQGRVWCESEAGKGATFFVELPSASELEISLSSTL
jgi:signal transduction histidine kinase